MTEALTQAVRQAVDALPGTSRALAMEAEIDPSLLTRILHFRRTVTPEVAEKLESALRRWGEACLEGAELIAKANNKPRRKK